MLEETRRFFASVMREDRSILELLDADYTFLNERLAHHYGIVDTHGTRVGKPPVQPGGQPIRGEDFVRVRLVDGERGGLLTQASVLSVTSNPTRTSPVKRGVWVLEQILGMPPPPAPPNVPELPDGEEVELTGSLRERFEQYRSNPVGANCHAQMDPIGFAFENYDAVGAFRTKDGPFEIDPSGQLPDGRQFRMLSELKEGSNKSYAFIDVPEGHHDLSHHGNDQAKKDKIRQINTFHVRQLAYLLEKLRSIPEGDGTLLGHAMIAYGSGNSDGNRHNHDDLPILLAGGGCGTLQPGRHIRYADETPLTNLWLAMLNRQSVEVARLGDSTGVLPGLAG